MTLRMPEGQLEKSTNQNFQNYIFLNIGPKMNKINKNSFDVIDYVYLLGDFIFIFFIFFMHLYGFWCPRQMSSGMAVKCE